MSTQVQALEQRILLSNFFFACLRGVAQYNFLLYLYDANFTLFVKEMRFNCNLFFDRCILI
jgi:hypothetical protein